MSYFRFWLRRVSNFLIISYLFCFVLFCFYFILFLFCLGPRPITRFEPMFAGLMAPDDILSQAHLKAQQKATASAKPKLAVCSLLAQQKRGPRTRPKATMTMHEQRLFSVRPCTSVICRRTTPASSCFAFQAAFTVTRRASQHPPPAGRHGHSLTHQGR